ncbi:hypothetical protein OTU49_003338, partial [Cherax quadricarinatus]
TGGGTHTQNIPLTTGPGGAQQLLFSVRLVCLCVDRVAPGFSSVIRMKFVCLAAGVTLLALAVAHNTHQGMNPGDNARTRREDSRIFFPGQPITKPVTQPVSQPEPRPKPDHRGVVALPKDLDL